MLYEWHLAPPIEVPPELRAAVGGHPLVAELLAQRGMGDPSTAAAFLDPAHYQPTPPETLPDMARAVALLREAITSSRHLRICGDFDADGHTSTAVLMEALLALGADVDYRLPERDEGHGLSRRIVEEAIREGVDLLLTCDTGIGDADLVALAVEAGITVIVTDHHDLPEALPPAQAILNPKYLPEDHPLRALAGVGVAYMLARALLAAPEHEPILSAMLDLVALGLIADVAAQVGEVRYLIQRGLAVMQQGQRPGMVAMAQVAGFDLAHADEETVGYQIGPRLNAAGRLADSAHVVRMLLTRDAAEALRLAQDLEALNRDRRARTDALLQQAEHRLANAPELMRSSAIILDGEDWEPAVLGLVAGSLARRYDRPALLIARRPDGTGLGSARSVEGIDIHQAIVSQRTLLSREGGHPMAAGFTLASLEHLEAFRQGLLNHLRIQAPEQRPVPHLAVDAEIPWSEATLELARELGRLKPFGPGNPRPTLALRVGTLERTEVLGNNPDSTHRRLFVSHGSSTLLSLVWFNAQALPQDNEPIDLALHLMENYWRGTARAEFHLVDWRPATASPAMPRLVAGREIVDWRDTPEALQRLAALRQELGPELLVWAEGALQPPPGAVSRLELTGAACVALAIASAPPSPAELRALIAAANPQMIYLLPPLPQPALEPNWLLQQVAGMVRLAQRRDVGVLDLARMAARLNLTEGVILAALECLDATGRLVLRRQQGRYEAVRPSPETVPDPAASEQVNATERVQHALADHLRQIIAYRAAYGSLSAEALLAPPPTP